MFCEEAMAGRAWLNDEPGRGFLAQVDWGLPRQKVLVGWTWGEPHLREDHQLDEPQCR